jgi:hypothetical protein
VTPGGCQAGRVVTLDAGVSRSPEAAITNYRWDTGNGATLDGPLVQYEYPEGTSGIQTICLTITNDAQFSDTLCKTFCIGRLFLRGDANTGATIDIADAIFILSCLFAEGPSLSCLDAADANDDGNVDRRARARLGLANGVRHNSLFSNDLYPHSQVVSPLLAILHLTEMKDDITIVVCRPH